MHQGNSLKRGVINSIVKINRNTRQNVKCKVDGRLESELICIACDPAPECRARWILRLLEKQIRTELDLLQPWKTFLRNRTILFSQ